MYALLDLLSYPVPLYPRPLLQLPSSPFLSSTILPSKPILLSTPCTIPKLPIHNIERAAITRVASQHAFLICESAECAFGHAETWVGGGAWGAFLGGGVGDATAREMRARMRVEVRVFAFDVEFGGWVGM
jgi:hypothetical protein